MPKTNAVDTKTNPVDTKTNPVDTTISRLECLQKNLTGRAAGAGDAPSTPIPPEHDPAKFVGEQMDRLLEILGSSPVETARQAPQWAPPLTVWEGELATVICVDVSGTARDSLDIQLAAGQLVVCGRRRSPADDANLGLRLVHVEMPFGAFRRVLLLPLGIAADGASACVRDGLLEIRLPHASPSRRSPRTIPVTWEPTGAIA